MIKSKSPLGKKKSCRDKARLFWSILLQLKQPKMSQENLKHQYFIYICVHTPSLIFHHPCNLLSLLLLQGDRAAGDAARCEMYDNLANLGCLTLSQSSVPDGFLSLQALIPLPCSPITYSVDLTRYLHKQLSRPNAGPWCTLIFASLSHFPWKKL